MRTSTVRAAGTMSTTPAGRDASSAARSASTSSSAATSSRIARSPIGSTRARSPRRAHLDAVGRRARRARPGPSRPPRANRRAGRGMPRPPSIGRPSAPSTTPSQARTHRAAGDDGRVVEQRARLAARNERAVGAGSRGRGTPRVTNGSPRRGCAAAISPSRPSIGHRPSERVDRAPTARRPRSACAASVTMRWYSAPCGFTYRMSAPASREGARAGGDLRAQLCGVEVHGPAPEARADRGTTDARRPPPRIGRPGRPRHAWRRHPPRARRRRCSRSR